ncbi:hypothetical protein LguiA_009509 [Lonicera macranthoides]
MAELEIVHQRIITRLDTLQSSIDALAANFDEQFRWIRQKLDPRGEASSSDPPVADLKLEVFSSAPVLNHEHKEFEIEAEWDHKVVEFEVDLVHKEINTEAYIKPNETTHSDVSNQPNSKISKVRSLSSMSIIEDSGECMIEKIDDNHGNSTGIFLPMADYANNMDLGVLNPLGNDSVLLQRLLYSKCSNYNIKEPLDRAISKLAEHGTIAIEVNDSMMNSESGMTIEVYIIKVLQGRVEFGFVRGSNGVLVINNTSPSSYKKMQLILNIRIFFPIVFDPGGSEELGGFYNSILEDKDC